VGTATPISYTPGSPAAQAGTLAADAADFYQITLTESGQLTAQVHATGFAPRLELLDPNGNSTPLIMSDGQSPANPDDLIVQHLEADPEGTTYFLEVQGLDDGGGDYTLTTQFDPGPSPFPPPAALPSPVAVVSGDFNNDGVPDLASLDGPSGSLTIELGRGDGTFQTRATYAVGPSPTALVAADLNGDGRLDLAVATADGLVVLLGTGDGTFRKLAPIAFAAGRPQAVVAGEFNGDHHLDLATANSTDDVSVFLGRGDGTFAAGQRVALPDGAGPTAITAGHFAGPDRLDLAVAESYPDRAPGDVAGLPGHGEVAVLRGNGDGTFGPAVESDVEVQPVALVAADFTGAGRDDLAVANKMGDGGMTDLGSVSILLSNPDGTFPHTASQRVEVEDAPVAIAVGHFFTGGPNGPPDLATVEASFGTVSFLQRQGDGTFQRVAGQTVFGTPASLAVADFNGDGSSDLAVGNGRAGGVDTWLVTPGASPSIIEPTPASSVRPTPLLGALLRPNVVDSVIVNRAGTVLLRHGQTSPVGSFAPAIPLDLAGGPARAVTILPAGSQTLLAAIDRLDDNISIYAIDADGTAHLQASLPTEVGSLPTRILAGNLRGVTDGYADLAVLSAGAPGHNSRIRVYLSDGHGGFGDAQTYDLGGGGRFDMTLADLTGKGRDDIVVVDQVSGDLNVLVNNGNGFSFALERYRAGAGPYGVSSDGTAILSGEGTAGVVAGDFFGDGVIDLATANADSHTLALLRGRGDGSFYNPVTIPLDFSPGAIAIGRFDGGSSPDLAVLDRDSGRVRIFLDDGHGNFSEKASPAPLWAGSAPANLSVADVNGDGVTDIQVGGDFGDVLTLLGNGDGTFRPFQAPDTLQTIDLAVADGRHFVLSDHAGDRLAEQADVGAASSVFQDRADGILAPGQVQTVTVGGTEYLVVANGGANDVLVYRGLGNGQFDAASVQTFFTGTDPVAVTVADVNGDGVPDVVVANQGSNDVSVLLGQVTGGAWTLTPGPRLASGGMGPVSTTVADVGGSTVPDLFVVNRQSNTVALLPGVGNGFFDDQNPRIFATGAGPVQAFVGNFDGSNGLLTIDAGANDLTLFSNFGPGLSIASGGLAPVAGFAGDFNGDGFTDLVIANNGDGVFTALLGGPDGLRLAGTLTSADVPRPTAVAFADLSAGALSLFATEEGVDSVARLTFALDFGVPVPTPGGGEPGGARPLVSELLPLNESTLDIVATLVTGSGLPGGATDLGFFLGAEGAGGLVVVATAFSGGGGGPGFGDDGGAGAAAGDDLGRPHQGNAGPGAFGAEAGALSDFIIGVGAEGDRIREGVRRNWRDAESTPPPPPPEAPRDEVFKGWPLGGAERLERLGGLGAAFRAAAGGLYDAAVSAAARGECSHLPRGVHEGQPAPRQPAKSLPLLDATPMNAPWPGSLEAALSSSGAGGPGGRDARGAGEEPERWFQALVAAVLVCGVKPIGGQHRRRGLPQRRTPASDQIR
jgi:hypothetical protein